MSLLSDVLDSIEKFYRDDEYTDEQFDETVVTYIFEPKYGCYRPYHGEIVDTFDNPLWGETHRVYIFDLDDYRAFKANSVFAVQGGAA